jgi:hypothetical protein
LGGDYIRKLIVIRIIHTPADMGSMKDGLEKEGVSKIGRQRWEENQRKIEKFWDEAEIEVLSLDVDKSKIRIYQDGLPVAGEIGERIVRETAERGSRNYDIIAKLMDLGAKIEATESTELLRQEYGLIKGFVEAKSHEERAAAEERYNQAKDELMEKRDSFIAKAIGSTLKEGEIGLLFIGAYHNVAPKLDKDIEVKCLD